MSRDLEVGTVMSDEAIIQAWKTDGSVPIPGGTAHRWRRIGLSYLEAGAEYDDPLPGHS